jgi:nitrogen regulatory protein PII
LEEVHSQMVGVVKITAWIRPHLADDVKTAISNLPIHGITQADVQGRGNSAESTIAFGGTLVPHALSLRAEIMVVCDEALTEAVIEAIQVHARTGHPGDGKIVVEPVADAIRIRTLERGQSAV